MGGGERGASRTSRTSRGIGATGGVGRDDARGTGGVTSGDDMTGGVSETGSKPCVLIGALRLSTGGTGIGLVALDAGVVRARDRLGPASTTIDGGVEDEWSGLGALGDVGLKDIGK